MVRHVTNGTALVLAYMYNVNHELVPIPACVIFFCRYVVFWERCCLLWIALSPSFSIFSLSTSIL